MYLEIRSQKLYYIIIKLLLQLLMYRLSQNYDCMSLYESLVDLKSIVFLTKTRYLRFAIES